MIIIILEVVVTLLVVVAILILKPYDFAVPAEKMWRGAFRDVFMHLMFCNEACAAEAGFGRLQFVGNELAA